MPTTTWRVARRDIARPFGLVTADTSTQINNDQLIVSTDLQQRYTVDDYFNGQWYATVVIQTDGAAPANGLGTTTKQVRDYAQSSGTVTVWGTALADESSDQVEFDLYRTFHPDDYKRAYNRARQAVFPGLAAHKDHRGIVTDLDTLVYPVPQAMRRVDRVSIGNAVLSSHTQNLFTDGGFEDWASTTSLTNWTLTGGSSVVNQEAATSTPQNHMVLSGSNSARLHVPSSDTTLLETLTPDVAVEGVYVVMAAYVYCRTASAIRCQIDSDQDTANNGSFHGGTGWEVITHEFKVSDTAGNIIAGVQAPGGTTASESYIDRAVVWAGPTSPPEGAWSPVTGWEWVPSLDGASDGGRVLLPAKPGNHEVLRLNGRGLLSSVSLDTDTVELDGDLLEPLYMKCREILCQDKAAENGDSDWGQRALDWRAEYNAWFAGESYHGSRPALTVSRRGPF